MREWLGGHLVTGQCEPTTGRYYYNVREKVVPLTSRPTNHGQVWESGATGGEEQLLLEPWIWIWMLGRAGDVRCCELWEEEGSTSLLQDWKRLYPVLNTFSLPTCWGAHTVFRS